jgi:hypothetical protein
MYKISDNIRIRECDELSFFVNIKSNLIYTIKTETLKFLIKKIKEGLTLKKVSIDKTEFIKFIQTLEKQKILEYKNDC